MLETYFTKIAIRSITDVTRGLYSFWYIHILPIWRRDLIVRLLRKSFFKVVQGSICVKKCLDNQLNSLLILLLRF
jgi:hypothetical protein